MPLLERQETLVEAIMRDKSSPLHNCFLEIVPVGRFLFSSFTFLLEASKGTISVSSCFQHTFGPNE